MRCTVAIFVVACCMCASTPAASLYESFRAPPRASRPWCYWYWVNGNVDRATATADLEAMKRVGFGGLLLVDPRGYDTRMRQPDPKMAFGGEEWRDMVAYAVRECDRIGLEFTMNLSSCGGSLKGPWLTGGDAPKRLVCGVDVTEVPAGYSHYRDIASFTVEVPADVPVKAGWRNAGGVTGRWQRDKDMPTVETVPPGTPGARKVSLRFGFCLIDGREHDVDVIDAAAVERHWYRITDELFAKVGNLVGKVWTHVYSVSWEGAIPTWTGGFEDEFRKRAGYGIREHLPALAGFVAGTDASGRRRADEVLRDYRRVRNLMFKDNFYGTVRRLAHARGLKLYSESGGPWNRDPSVFLEADQLAFLGVNDMPQGEFWTVRPSHHTELEFNRAAANAAHIYGLPRASAEAFTHMSYHYSMTPSRLKRSADCAFADGINHFVWHTFTCSPKPFGQPGIEYFAGTHINPNVTWFGEAGAFVDYIARCQVLLQAGEPVTDIAVYGGRNPYRHWGRYRHLPWDGARLAIPRGYCYDVLNDETLHRKRDYPVFVDGTADTVAWPPLPPPDVEGPFDDFIHRRLADGTDVYFVISADKGSRDATFRVRGKVAEIWNPVVGTRRVAQDARETVDGRTKLRLSLTNDGSLFVVFRPREMAAADPAPPLDWPQGRKGTAIGDQGWRIDIGGKPFGRLGDWTKSDDPDIRYFAGRAFYRTSFTLDAAERRDRTLYLGRVAGGVAKVLVNGHDCGIAWCYPYRVKVPASVLAVGRNELEVQVVNTWRNRLIGDCLLPARERRTRSFMKYDTGPHNTYFNDGGFGPRTSGYSANDSLDSCGLYGPVELH